jgi:iron complex outermembrane receptor protein
MTPARSPVSPTARIRLPSLVRLLHSWTITLTLACCAFAANPAKKSFDVPAGDAARTLRSFSEQSGEQIIFPVEQVRGVRTQAVKGQLSTREALDLMLAGTALVAEEDKVTGAFAVRKGVPDPNAPRPASNANAGRADRQVPRIPSAGEVAGEQVVEMSPFVVSSEGDDGYRAASTLAGSRMNAPLLITPASISVLTKELLDDLGAENTEQYLKFSVSSDREFGSDTSGANMANFDIEVNIRGFPGATITRDYFPFALSADRYNVERIDLNRGPNSILYGIGAPGGVINSTSKQARIGGKTKSVSVTVGSFNKRRTENDFAFPIVKDRLALRLNTLWEDRKGWSDFEFYRQKGIALAATYRVFRNTHVRAMVEHNDRKQNLAGQFPAVDLGGTRWKLAGAPLSGDPLQPGTNPNPAVLRSRNVFQVMYAPQLRAQPFRLSTTGADMRPDLPGTQAPGYWDTIPGVAGYPAGTPVSDPNFQVIPAEANLSGPGSTTNNYYTNGSIFIDHRIGNLSIELAANRHQQYRVARGVLGSVGEGAIGDANLVLPGAYFADGDSVVAAGRSPGTLLPDIGARNPYAGSLYVEGQANERFLSNEHEQYRISLGYDLDLTKRSQWLGRHAFAGLWQKGRTLNQTEIGNEYNVTPKNGQLIDSPTNEIWRRTYLDFSTPGGMRGALDPWTHPIPSSTGVTAKIVTRGPATLGLKDLESKMIAVQSRFLRERLVVTAGYRDDTESSNVANAGGERLPNSTNLWTKYHTIMDPSRETVFSGRTKTVGAVFTPVRWLGLTYNQADAILPQGQLDMVQKPIGTRAGLGRDYGIRLNLLENRLYLTANRYFTDDENRALISNPIQVAAVPSINAVLNTLTVSGRPLPKKFAEAGVSEFLSTGRDRIDSKGDGAEIELVGRITKGWSVSVNGSRNNVRIANPAPDINQLLRDVERDWKGNATQLRETPDTVATFVRTRDATPSRDFAVSPATFNDAYESAASAVAQVNQQDGQAPHLHVRESLNFFTSYRFDDRAPGLLRHARIGFGGNYRAAPVIGFDAAHKNAPIMGKSTSIFSLMLGKKIPLQRGRSWDFQLNVQNLFAQEDLLPFGATAPGVIVRYIYPRTRKSFDLRAVHSF